MRAELRAGGLILLWATSNCTGGHSAITAPGRESGIPIECSVAGAGDGEATLFVGNEQYYLILGTHDGQLTGSVPADLTIPDEDVAVHVPGFAPEFVSLVRVGDRLRCAQDVVLHPATSFATGTIEGYPGPRAVDVVGCFARTRADDTGFFSLPLAARDRCQVYVPALESPTGEVPAHNFAPKPGGSVRLLFSPSTAMLGLQIKYTEQGWGVAQSWQEEGLFRPGDVITSAGGMPVAGVSVVDWLHRGRHARNDKVVFGVVRDGASITVEATLLAEMVPLCSEWPAGAPE